LFEGISWVEEIVVPQVGFDQYDIYAEIQEKHIL